MCYPRFQAAPVYLCVTFQICKWLSWIYNRSFQWSILTAISQAMSANIRREVWHTVVTKTGRKSIFLHTKRNQGEINAFRTWTDNCVRQWRTQNSRILESFTFCFCQYTGTVYALSFEDCRQWIDFFPYIHTYLLWYITQAHTVKTFQVFY